MADNPRRRFEPFLAPSIARGALAPREEEKPLTLDQAGPGPAVARPMLADGTGPFVLDQARWPAPKPPSVAARPHEDAPTIPVSAPPVPRVDEDVDEPTEFWVPIAPERVVTDWRRRIIAALLFIAVAALAALAIVGSI